MSKPLSQRDIERENLLTLLSEKNKDFTPDRSLAESILGDRSRIPVKLASYIDTVPSKMLEMTDEELFELQTFSSKDERLRVSFWKEVQLADAEDRDLCIKSIIKGVCSEGYFYKAFSVPQRAAYLLRPLVPLTDTFQALLSEGLNKLSDIIHMDLTSQKKYMRWSEEFQDYVPEYRDELDTKKAQLLVDVVEKLGNRVLGSAVQISALVAPTKEPNAVPMIGGKVDDKAIEAQITKIQEQLGE